CVDCRHASRIRLKAQSQTSPGFGASSLPAARVDRVVGVERVAVKTDIEAITVQSDVPLGNDGALLAERDDRAIMVPLRWDTQRRARHESALGTISAHRTLAQMRRNLCRHVLASHPINARTSMTGAFNGATPIAIVSATKPSILPVERFFEGLRLPASSSAM